MISLDLTNNKIKELNNLFSQDNLSEAEINELSLIHTQIAISLINDFGFEMASRVADVINSIVMADGD